MALTLDRLGVAAGVGAATAVAGPLAAAGALAAGTYLQVAQPSAFPGLDAALTDGGAALLGRAFAPASVWLAMVALAGLGGLVLYEVLDELGMAP